MVSKGLVAPVLPSPRKDDRQRPPERSAHWAAPSHRPPPHRDDPGHPTQSAHVPPFDLSRRSATPRQRLRASSGVLRLTLHRNKTRRHRPHSLCVRRLRRHVFKGREERGGREVSRSTYRRAWAACGRGALNAAVAGEPGPWWRTLRFRRHRATASARPRNSSRSARGGANGHAGDAVGRFRRGYELDAPPLVLPPAP